VTVPPGWYPDPVAGDGSDGEELRWWDGARWTDQVCQPEPARRSAWRAVTITLTVTAVAFVGVVIAVAVWFSLALRSTGNK
jgi:hypothetical protein